MRSFSFRYVVHSYPPRTQRTTSEEMRGGASGVVVGAGKAIALDWRQIEKINEPLKLRHTRYLLATRSTHE